MKNEAKHDVKMVHHNYLYTYYAWGIPWLWFSYSQHRELWLQSYKISTFDQEKVITFYMKSTLKFSQDFDQEDIIWFTKQHAVNSVTICHRGFYSWFLFCTSMCTLYQMTYFKAWYSIYTGQYYCHELHEVQDFTPQFMDAHRRLKIPGLKTEGGHYSLQ